MSSNVGGWLGGVVGSGVEIGPTEVEPGVGNAVGAGVSICAGVGNMVADGLGVGGGVGPEVAASPPHAAIKNIKIRKTPVLDMTANERTPGIRCKTVPPLLVVSGALFHSSAIYVLITRDGNSGCFKGSVHPVPGKPDGV